MDTFTSLAAITYPLCLGSNTFGWTSDEDESRSVLDAFVEGGGTFIDTADNYSWWVDGNSGGESEGVIGRWMRDRGARERVVVATKCGRHPEFAGLSRTSIHRAADASLERLQTGYIDVLYAHRDDPTVPLEETVAAFDELRVAGKIRAVGLSNYSGDRITEWMRIADENGFARPVALQPHLNLLFRREFESDLRPVIERFMLAVVPYFGLASGFLTGKYRTRSDIDRSPRASMLEVYYSQEALRVVDALADVASAHGISPATAALAWLRVQPGVVAPVASASRLDQVTGLLESTTVELSSEELRHLDELSAVLPVEGEKEDA
jgi:aryl-alcohol dehydrogenase (NADP+)